MPTITITVPDSALPTLRVILAGLTDAETMANTKLWLVDRLKELIRAHLEETVTQAARRAVQDVRVT